MEMVDDKIRVLEGTIKHHKVTEVLKDKDAREYLSYLHEHFVLARIDKATGNVSIICKRFYAEVLVKELGLDERDNNNGTYVHVSDTSTEAIIQKHIRELSSKLGIDLSEEDQCLPHMYWLPKKHKVPSKQRFIVAAVKCTLKPISKMVTSLFKLFYRQIENYNKKLSFFSGVNKFWVILNNTPIREAIDKLNSRKCAKSITTFDFSTLYTKIPHDKLIDVLHNLVNFCFKGGSSKFIAITDRGARWVQNPSQYSVCFNSQSVKDSITYILNNCFFTFGNFLMRQTIGIPMGSDPAPFFANLFLYHYESKWLTELMKTDLQKARKFSNTFRFIDDLGAINDQGEFEIHFKEIYPPEMELKKENNGSLEASFLDLSISISSGVFNSKLYDKRDNFPFAIIRMPYRCSNMPSTIYYSSIGAEILRICKASTNKNDCINSAKLLISRMICQGAEKVRLRNTLRKFYGRHMQIFQKVSENSIDFVNLLTT